MALRVNTFTLSSAIPKIESRAGNSRIPSLNVNSQMKIQMRNGGGGGGRKIWRRRTMTKKDPSLPRRMERTPFYEEHVNKIKDEDKLVHLDTERLLLSEENKYDFVNEIAAEARAHVERNMDEYGGDKKAVFHALSDRMNEAGMSRPEAYVEPDLFKPGPRYSREFNL